ncbi:MAG: hypothetical protein IPI12_14155 [Ignavibacteriales bacterium]|nr:hypothetical protein [Ignavibacteriales bacterium]
MSIEVTPRADEAYAATWLAFTQSGQIYTEDTKYNTVVRKLPGAAANTLQILSAEVPASYASKPQDLGAGIYVYDTSLRLFQNKRLKQTLRCGVWSTLNFCEMEYSWRWNWHVHRQKKTVKAISSSR